MKRYEIIVPYPGSSDYLITSIVRRSAGTLETENADEYREVFEKRVCDCHLTFKNLRNLRKKVSSKRSAVFKWIAFADFVMKYGSSYHRLILVDCVIAPVTCSLKIASVLLNRLLFYLRSSHIPLPIILETVVREVYVENCENIAKCVLIGLENKLRYSESPEAPGILNAIRDYSNIIKIILNFGFISNWKDTPCCHHIKSLINRFITVCDHDSVAATLDEALNLANKAVFYCNEEERSKRLLLATTAVRATQLSLEDKNEIANDFIQFIRAFFVATNDPFLTVFEVRSLLYACFSATKRLDLYDIYSQTFDKLMPECPLGREPRKLRDLVRFTIRHNLVSPLPLAAMQLHLPESLKDFVVGNINDTSRLRMRNIDSSEEDAIKENVIRSLFN